MTPNIHPFLRARLRGLYVITTTTAAGGHIGMVRAALAGGAGIIQLRDKTTPLRALLEPAHELRRLTRAAGALLIVNDRLDLAQAVGADGVHLGPDDMPPAVARQVLGPHRLVGVSCGDPQEARAALQAGADYIGAGAVYATGTKSDAGAPIGLDRLRSIVDSTGLPVAAIGGIGPAEAAAVTRTGAAMVCAISAIAGAGDETAMAAATRGLVRALHS